MSEPGQANLADIIGIPQEPRRQRFDAERVVAFYSSPDRPDQILIGEECDQCFGVNLDASQLTHLIYFLHRRLVDMAEHVENTSVPIVHLSGCCGWPLDRQVEVVDDTTWTTTRCGKCGKHHSTFADRGELDIGILPEQDPS